MGRQWPAAGWGALSVAVSEWDLLTEVAINFITSTIVWPQVKNRGGTQPHPSTEHWIKDLLSKAPPIRTRSSFPLSLSLPSGSFHNPLILIHQRVKWSEVTQLCQTLCDPMDCSLPGSSAYGIFQAIVLEWIAISFSRGSSPPRDWTRVSHIVGRCFTVWATREVLINLMTWTTALSNSMKLWAMLFRATQDGWVMEESSDNTWFTGEGNGKPL